MDILTFERCIVLSKIQMVITFKKESRNQQMLSVGNVTLIRKPEGPKKWSGGKTEKQMD